MVFFCPAEGRSAPNILNVKNKQLQLEQIGYSNLISDLDHITL